MSEGSLALEFIPEEKKTYVDGLCYYYCADTCLRTVIISINPAEERELSLRVCERGKLETCAFYSGNRYYEPSNPATSLSFVSTGKLYHVALPNGRYEASFFDTEGSRVWPKFVEETYGDPLCEDSLTVGSFWIPEPPVQIAECASLLQNGDAEMSGETHSHWITGPGGINVLPNQGTGNIIESSSQAFCDAVSPNGNSGGYSIGQYIDTRCFVDNQMYKVEASVRLTEKTTNLPISMECPDGKSCPTIGFFFVSKDGFSWFQELNHRSTNIFANRRHLATNDGYERVEGKLLINPEIASAASVFFYIKRNNNDENVLFCMDDISITLNTDVGDL